MNTQLERVRFVQSSLQATADRYGLPVGGPAWDLALQVERQLLRRELGLPATTSLSLDELRFEHELQEREEAL